MTFVNAYGCVCLERESEKALGVDHVIDSVANEG